MKNIMRKKSYIVFIISLLFFAHVAASEIPAKTYESFESIIKALEDEAEVKKIEREEVERRKQEEEEEFRELFADLDEIEGVSGYEVMSIVRNLALDHLYSNKTVYTSVLSSVLLLAGANYYSGPSGLSENKDGVLSSSSHS